MRKLLLAAAVIVFTQTADGRLIGSVNISQLTQDSGLVVKGRLAGVSIAKALTKPQDTIYSIQVSYVIKGDELRPGSVLLAHRIGGQPSLDLMIGQGGVFFLNKDLGSIYNFVSPDHPSVVAAVEPQPVRPDGDDIAHVTAEIAAVFAEPVIIAGNPHAGVARTLTLVGDAIEQQDGAVHMAYSAPSHTRIAEDTYLRAAEALRSVPAGIRRSALDRLSVHSDEPLQTVWIDSQRLRSGESNVLPEIAKIVLSTVSVDDVTARFVAENVGHSAASVSAIPSLGQLSTARQIVIRKAALTALGKIGSKAAIPYLIAALGDPTEKVRLAAVSAICTTIENCGGESLSDMSK